MSSWVDDTSLSIASSRSKDNNDDDVILCPETPEQSPTKNRKLPPSLLFVSAIQGQKKTNLSELAMSQKDLSKLRNNAKKCRSKVSAKKEAGPIDAFVVKNFASQNVTPEKPTSSGDAKLSGGSEVNKTPPKPSPMSQRFKELFNSPTFIAKKHGAARQAIEETRAAALERPRCKAARALMKGYECDCCRAHYDALGLVGQARIDYINRVSKHRTLADEAQFTPPRYWDTDAPTAEEQVALGYVVETSSPLFKKKSAFRKRRLILDDA